MAYEINYPYGSDENIVLSNVEFTGRSYISKDETFTIAFRLKSLSETINDLNILVYLKQEDQDYDYARILYNYQCGAQSIAKGKYKDFSFDITMNSDDINEYAVEYDGCKAYLSIEASTGDTWEGSIYQARVLDVFTYVHQRVAPVPIRYTFLDAQGEFAWRQNGPAPNAAVGDHNLKVGFVEDYSQMYFYGSADLDEQDPTLTCTHYVTIYTDNTKTNVLYDGYTIKPTISTPGISIFPGNLGLAKATIGKIANPGIYPCECYTIDSAGLVSETIYGNLEIRKYDIPIFNQFYGERLHVTYDTDGSILEVVPSLAGELKILNFDFEVQQLYVKKDSGHNAGLVYGEQTTTGELVEYTNTFSLTVSYTGSDGSTGSVVVQVGAVIENDKYKIKFSDEPENLFPDAVFSDAEDYTFTATVADMFTTVSYNTYINKVTGIFDIEKNGVAVGMLSTGTDEEKKFEVHEDYNTYLYGNANISKDLNVIGGLTVHGGISGVTNYALAGIEEPTGGIWIDGRPIYRHVWTGKTTLDGAQDELYALPSVPSTVISLGGMFRRSDGAWIPIPNVYYASVNWCVNIRTDANGNVLVGFGSSYNGEKELVVTTLYTKSTDQPYTRLDIATLDSTILK